MAKATTTKVSSFLISRIKGIIFDLDNTLYNYEPAHRAGLIASHKKYPVNSSFAKYVAKYETARINNEQFLFGTGSSHNRLLYFQRMLEAEADVMGDTTNSCFSPSLALELTSSYWIAFIKAMRLEPNLRETLLFLVRRYKLGILSDLTADIQFAKITAHRLWPFFDAIVVSEEAGAEKPSIVGLRMLLRKMHLHANQVILVGDNPAADGLCAQQLRIPFIQIVRPDMQHMKKTGKGASNKSGIKIWRKIKKLQELKTILAA